MKSRSPSMQTVERTIAQIAPTDIPILLIGESGTGKEFMARHIHRLSSRAAMPLKKMVCASLSDPTSAVEFANAGGSNGQASTTVFLKEISELDSASQRSLLYALPELGLDGGKANAGPRLVSSTASNLEEEMRAGRFRAELYYRINGVSLRLPALNQRREDIPELVELFLNTHSASQGKPKPYMDAQDMASLQELSWPGNIRELENVVKKIVVLNDSKAVISELAAGKADLRPSSASQNGSVLKTATKVASRGAEQELILNALRRTHWNRKRAAQELQISYKSLLSKLKLIGAEELEKV